MITHQTANADVRTVGSSARKCEFRAARLFPVQTLRLGMYRGKARQQAPCDWSRKPPTPFHDHSHLFPLLAPIVWQRCARHKIRQKATNTRMQQAVHPPLLTVQAPLPR